MLALLSQKADNITFVINQQELCDNVIGVNVLKDLGFSKSASAQGSQSTANGSSDTQVIKDFTLVDFRFLVVLMSNNRNLVVFDCHQVLSGSARQVRNINVV